MKIFNKLFKQKATPINNYSDFWNWFSSNESLFYETVKNGKNIEQNFLNPLHEKLNELKTDVFYYLTGMYDEHTVELIFSAEGIIKNIVFIEDLVASAPDIPNWKFTCLKPESEIGSSCIQFDDLEFDKGNLKFCAEQNVDSPDEIDISIIYDFYSEDNKDIIERGVYLFLDNYLGELAFAESIDNLTIRGTKEFEEDLIPIEKLKEYLKWRKKEFNEKYQGMWIESETDNYSSFQAETPEGLPIIAVINTSILHWDRKASHPWIAYLEISYNGEHTNGLPNEKDQTLLNKIDDFLENEVKPSEGCINIGRETGVNSRVIYLACKDFRPPSRILSQVQLQFAGNFKIEYGIYKDKYWRTFDKYVQ